MTIVHVPIGHGYEYVHPAGQSSRVSCSGPDAMVRIGFGDGKRWQVVLCFNGNRIPLEAILEPEGRGKLPHFMCIAGQRQVGSLRSCR